jgi:hypothetical protein
VSRRVALVFRARPRPPRGQGCWASQPQLNQRGGGTGAMVRSSQGPLSCNLTVAARLGKPADSPHAPHQGPRGRLRSAVHPDARAEAPGRPRLGSLDQARWLPTPGSPRRRRRALVHPGAATTGPAAIRRLRLLRESLARRRSPSTARRSSAVPTASRSSRLRHGTVGEAIFYAFELLDYGPGPLDHRAALSPRDRAASSISFSTSDLS